MPDVPAASGAEGPTEVRMPDTPGPGDTIMSERQRGMTTDAAGAYATSQSLETRGTPLQTPPPVTADPPQEPAPVSEVARSGRTSAGVLGRLVFARSGDKGGTANVGVWIPAGHPRRAEAYAWLRAWLTPAEVVRLLPEAAGLGVEVFALPNLAAVNIVIDGLLGDGVASSTRFDPQAKAVGEWLRARHLEIPEVLL